MARSTSYSHVEAVLPLIPCPRCQSRIIMFVSHRGERFYKCVNKDAGLCSFLRSTDTYLSELTRADFSQPQVMHHPVAVHQSAPLQHRSTQVQDAMDGSQAEIQPSHVRVRPQVHQAPPLPVAATHCCSNDTQRTVLQLARTNLIIVVSFLYLIFGQQCN
uniref:Uncharacterized protein n=1 Tax=Hordeum vulgare subsp. vulgare TaxID=112509 RepID=A0A8I7B8S6_HORVV